MNLWSNYHAPDITVSPKQANTFRLALWWPLHLAADPVAVSGSAVGAYLITGALPWQLADWTQGLRWYLLGAGVYWVVLESVKAEGELKYIETHMPPWLKNIFGF